MASLLAVATVLSATFGVTRVLQLRFVHALPLTVLSITCTLYLAYIAGVLHAAWWLVVVLCVSSGVVGVVSATRQGSWRTLLVPSAPLVTFTVAMMLVFYYTDGRHVAAHDELRLWGAYPKLLFFDGSLQVGPDSLLMGEMQTYTPGLPLFGYFVAAFASDFTDRSLFLADGLFAMALLAPIGARTTWRRPAGVVLLGVGMALLPLMFANNAVDAGIDFYASLFSDPVIGIVLGYVLWLTTVRRVDSLVWCVQLGTALAALYLVKTSGLGLGAIVLVLAVARWLLATRGGSIRRRVVGTATMATPLLVAWTTWNVIQARLGPPTKFDSAGTTATLDMAILREYVSMLIGRSEYAPGIGMFPQYTSFVIMNAAMVTALICIAIARGGERSRVILAATVTLVITQLVFVIGIYALIVGPFEGRILSFPRITSTMLTAASVLLALVAANDWPAAVGRRGAWARAVACACAGLPGPELPAPGSRHVGRGVGGARGGPGEQARRRRWARATSPNATRWSRCCSRSTPRTPSGTTTACPTSSWAPEPASTSASPTDPAASEAFPPPGAEQPPAYKQNVPTPAAEFARYLIDEDVRFVLVAQDNPALVAQYADWFDRPPTANSLYRVVVRGESVELVWVA